MPPAAAAALCYVLQAQLEDAAMTIGKKTSLERRKFLGTLGASAGAAAVAAGTLNAPMPATAQKVDDKNAAPLKIIDFHNHYMGPSLTLTNLAAVPPAQKQYWEGVNRKLADPAALTASIESAGIAARVINTPTAFIEDADGKVPADIFPRINDHLAELVSRNPGRLYGLATVDAYSGDAGARELTRAVRELGLRGVFVESAKNDLLLDAKEARPTLGAAASLGIPVFVHPITDPTMHKRFVNSACDLLAAPSTPLPCSRCSKAARSTNCLICASWSRRLRSEACCSPADSATAIGCAAMPRP
jgi:aminocarboxymuconate-semialdehyde decarboxylase